VKSFFLPKRKEKNAIEGEKNVAAFCCNRGDAGEVQGLPRRYRGSPGVRARGGTGGRCGKVRSGDFLFVEKIAKLETLLGMQTVLSFRSETTNFS